MLPYSLREGGSPPATGASSSVKILLSTPMTLSSPPATGASSIDMLPNGMPMGASPPATGATGSTALPLSPPPSPQWQQRLVTHSDGPPAPSAAWRAGALEHCQRPVGRRGHHTVAGDLERQRLERPPSANNDHFPLPPPGRGFPELDPAASAAAARQALATRPARTTSCGGGRRRRMSQFIRFDPAKAPEGNGRERTALRGVKSESDLGLFQRGFDPYSRSAFEARNNFKLFHRRRQQKTALTTWSALHRFAHSEMPLDVWLSHEKSERQRSLGYAPAGSPKAILAGSREGELGT